MTQSEDIDNDEGAMDRIIHLYQGEGGKRAFDITLTTIAYYLEGFECQKDVKRVKELIIDWINSQELDDALKEVKSLNAKGRLH